MFVSNLHSQFMGSERPLKKTDKTIKPYRSLQIELLL